MPFDLRLLDSVHDVLVELQQDEDRASLCDAVEAILDKLEQDPGDPKLGTTMFRTSGLEHVRSTPVRQDEWVLIWQLGEGPSTINLIWIGRP